MIPPREQRIAKLLARAGVASRREIERMIEDGRIAVNGVTIDKPATLLGSLHGITVDGQPVSAPAPARLFRYHKPPGLLTTEHDPKGRPIIYDRLPKGLPRVMPVGRLDMNTEGLLLLTTDGELKRTLELPATGVERSYRARVFGEVSQAQLEELIHGVEIEGVRYGAIDANLERRTGRNGWVEMRLREGKNREVRRVLEYLGLQVSRLIRTAYGPFVLGDLPAGAVDEVRQHDLVAFRKMLSGDRSVSLSDDRSASSAARPQRAAASARPDSRPNRSSAGPRRDAKPMRTASPAPRDARPNRPDSRGDARPTRTDNAPPRDARASRPGARGDARPNRTGSAPTRDARPGRPAPAATRDSRSNRPDTTASRDARPKRPATAAPRDTRLGRTDGAAPRDARPKRPTPGGSPRRGPGRPSSPPRRGPR